jgi:hypothetical protein
MKRIPNYITLKYRQSHQGFFFFFTDAQCVHLWLYGRHLYDNPFHPTRMSAYHGRPEPQQRWYCCFLAAHHGSYARVLSLKNTWRVSLYWRKNYHDPLRSFCCEFFKCFKDLWITRYLYLYWKGSPCIIKFVLTYWRETWSDSGARKESGNVSVKVNMWP